VIYEHAESGSLAEKPAGDSWRLVAVYVKTPGHLSHDGCDWTPADVVFVWELESEDGTR